MTNFYHELVKIFISDKRTRNVFYFPKYIYIKFSLMSQDKNTTHQNNKLYLFKLLDFIFQFIISVLVTISRHPNPFSNPL